MNENIVTQSYHWISEKRRQQLSSGPMKQVTLAPVVALSNIMIILKQVKDY